MFLHFGGSALTFGALAYVFAYEEKLLAAGKANDGAVSGTFVGFSAFVWLLSLPIWYYTNRDECTEIETNAERVACQATRNANVTASAWSLILLFCLISAILAAAKTVSLATALGTAASLGVLMQGLYLCSTLPYPPLPQPVPTNG